MREIPKIVRARLSAADSPGAGHPDADVLTAFGEGCLPASERTAVVDHLARCAECRDVVALALPASEALQPTMQISRGSRLAWPVVRWAFVSAGAVAIALFGFVEYGHRTASVRMAKNSAEPYAQARNEAKPAAAAQDKIQANEERPQASSAGKIRTDLMVPKDKEEAVPVPAPRLTRNFAAGAMAHGPRQTNQWQQQNAKSWQAPTPGSYRLDAKQLSGVQPTTVSGANSVAEVQPQSAQHDVASEALDSTIAGNPPATQPPPPSPSDTEVSRAKSAPAMAAPARIDAPAGALQGRSVQALFPVTPTWTVNAGRLQRSFDQGVSWQDVKITANSDATASLELAVASRKAAKQTLKKDKTADSATPIFRVVAANGPDVWAGGTEAALYHSPDTGAHWVRVVPSTAGATLTGDIVALEFSDAQNGRVSTSTGEVWLTSDDGRSWQKQ